MFSIVLQLYTLQSLWSQKAKHINFKGKVHKFKRTLVLSSKKHGFTAKKHHLIPIWAKKYELNKPFPCLQAVIEMLWIVACLATMSRIVCLLFQFYKCFRQLFHCQSPSSSDGELTCHSKVTVIQLNQRMDGRNVCNNEPRPETDSKTISLLHPEPSLEPVSKAVPPMS